MIKLFHIPPYKIDTGKFTNLLHDRVVRRFEEKFAEYTGFKHCVSLHSATLAIQCILGKFFTKEIGETRSIIKIPNMIPVVVPNAIINSGNKIEFTDNWLWVGGVYLLHKFSKFKVIDSAQEITRNFSLLVGSEDLVIFSFYPSKPCGGCDGSCIVSNDPNKIEILRSLVNNGETLSNKSWNCLPMFPGQKAYMNSIQAQIALNNLRKINRKKACLDEVREKYDQELSGFTLNSHNSYHLYRIAVKNRDEFIRKMTTGGVECGIHYRPLYHSLVKNPYYKKHIIKKDPRNYYQTNLDGNWCVSLPFHEKLTNKDVQKVLRLTLKYAKQI